MSLKIARHILELIQLDNEAQIREILDLYSLDQRRCIMSIKHKRSSLLFIAVVKERVFIITYFLDSCGADPDSSGWLNGVKSSCLAVAVDGNYETIVRILLEHGANTEVVSSYGRTPLFHACSNDRESIVRLLIEYGADVNSRNYAGETPLTESTEYLYIFKYLISNGADVNLVDDFGQTVLMVACETEEDDIIYFLLSCEDIDVRMRNVYGEDALHLAVRYSCGNIVKEIINKGFYTKEEIIEVYELESCFLRVEEDEDKARELWQKALQLRSKSPDTPMFEIYSPAGNFEKFVGVLNFGDVSALCFLESVLGKESLFTLGAYICAACNVSNEDNFIDLCEFFFETLHTLENGIFLKSFRQTVVLIRHFLYVLYPSSILNLSRIFGMFVAFVAEIRLRLERMTPQERMPYANEVECLLYFAIELVCKIEEKYPEEMDLFHENVERILKTDLRGQRLKFLTQICGSLQCPESIMKSFIRCGANVNSTDKEGKTVLHEVVESDIPSRKKNVEKIIDNGFDFSRVIFDEYCLPCRMERENLTPHSVKYISLQCLASRTLCENTTNCLSDFPYYLRKIINSHLFLT